MGERQPDMDATGVQVFRPSQAVWSRVIWLILAGFVVVNATIGVLQAANPEIDYLDTRLPVHLLFGVFGVGYLVFLRRALFLALASGCEVRADAEGLVIQLRGESHRFAWNEVRRISPGDIHLVVRAGGERYAIPFLSRASQRALFRLHFNHRGLTPNEMPMTTFPRSARRGTLLPEDRNSRSDGIEPG